MNGLDGNDDLDGNSGNDILVGDDGDDYLFGDTGNDYLQGHNGDDSLSGYYDSDTLLVSTSSSATAIDFSDNALQQLERLDMRDNDDSDSVTLRAADVVSVSDDDIFRVLGDAGDEVTSTDTWTRGSDTFATYTAASAELHILLGLDFNGSEVVAL